MIVSRLCCLISSINLSGAFKLMSDKNPETSEQSVPVSEEGSHVRAAMERKNRLDREAKEKRRNLDPTRYGDWEKNGRCIDF